MTKRQRGKRPIPIATFEKQLIECGVLDQTGIDAVKKRVKDRNARAAVRAAQAIDPPPADVIKYMYTDTTSEKFPPEFQM